MSHSHYRTTHLLFCHHWYVWHLSQKHSGLFSLFLLKSPSQAGSADTQTVILKTHWHFKDPLPCSFFLTSCSYQKHTSNHAEKSYGKYPKYTQQTTWQNLLVGVKTKNNMTVPEQLSDKDHTYTPPSFSSSDTFWRRQMLN